MASSGYASYADDEFKNPKYDVHTIPLQTEEQLPPEWGTLVDRFDSADVKVRDIDAYLGGKHVKIWVPKDVVHGTFVVWREGDLIRGQNEAVGSGLYTTARYKGPNQLYVREYNYHPESDQIIYPWAREPFISVMGRGDDIRAFKFSGEKGLCINAGTWHQPPIPLTPKQVFNNAQSKAHLCVCYDTLAANQRWTKFDLV
jgi:ureidoglycolate hydrolase